MRRFRWLGALEIPRNCDLRHCGWSLVQDDVCLRDGTIAVLADRRRIDGSGWLALLTGKDGIRMQKVILLGVAAADEHGALLRLGFGEVLGLRPDFVELEARALRVARSGDVLPRHKRLGRLTLDLLSRDGLVGTQVLGLHPREFALAWRLMEDPGKPIAKRTLLQDVWGLRHVPETNSLAVHVARLRTKLRLAGLEGMLGTTADGSYYLSPVTEKSPSQPSMALSGPDWADWHGADWPGALWQDHGS